MENYTKSKRQSSGRRRKTRTDETRPNMYVDPNAGPQTSFFSDSPSQTTSPQTPQDPGPPGAMYTSQQTYASSRRSQPRNYPGPTLPSGLPAQNGPYPSTFGHQTGTGRYPQPAGSRPNGPPRSFTHPSPSSRNAFITEAGKAKISDGRFAILTDDPQIQGEHAVLSKVKEVDITGGWFVVASGSHASRFFNDTAEVANRASREDKRNGDGEHLDDHLR